MEFVYIGKACTGWCSQSREIIGRCYCLLRAFSHILKKFRSINDVII